MKKTFPIYIFVMIGLLSMAGCESPDEEPPSPVPPPPETVDLIGAEPPSGRPHRIKHDHYCNF